MKKFIIGLIGSPGVGKDTVALLIEQATGKKTEKFSFSRVLIDEYCAHLGIEPTHPNLQYIGDAIRPQWLHARAQAHIEASEAEIIIIPSIRRAADFNFVKSFKNHLLLGITTDEKLAYERMKLRKEKPEEEHLTWEAYQILKTAPIDQEIPSLLKKVEKTVANNGTPAELQKALTEIFSHE